MVFEGMVTQWYVGPGGPVGLRYEALPVVMDAREIPQADRPQVFNLIRVMEGEALRAFGERREE